MKLSSGTESEWPSPTLFPKLQLCPQVTKLCSLQAILKDTPAKDWEPDSGYV